MNTLVNNYKRNETLFKKPKQVSKEYTLKKAPIKYEMPESVGVCGMVPKPAYHVPPKRKNKKTKL